MAKKTTPKKKTNRIEEVSERLGKLSYKLLQEGTQEKSDELLKLGSIIFLLSIVVTNKEELKEVHNLTAMFSAKKVLDSHPELFLELGFDGHDEK